MLWQLWLKSRCANEGCSSLLPVTKGQSRGAMHGAEAWSQVFELDIGKVGCAG